MGAFKAIRNPAVHWTGDGNPAMAGEQLAALSIIAHWVHYWDVVCTSAPVPTAAEWLEQNNAEPGGQTPVEAPVRAVLPMTPLGGQGVGRPV